MGCQSLRGGQKGSGLCTFGKSGACVEPEWYLVLVALVDYFPSPYVVAEKVRVQTSTGTTSPLRNTAVSASFLLPHTVGHAHTADLTPIGTFFIENTFLKRCQVAWRKAGVVSDVHH